MDLILEAKRLSQGYGRRTVVDNVDLKLGTGRVGLLGPNGAGKTTLLRMLATVTPPRSGELYVDGRAVRRPSDVRRARQRIGWLPQHFGYFPGFSVIDFVRYCAWLREVSPADSETAVGHAISAVGLGDYARVPLRKLSGGMLRRCGIAQAIVGCPRLVLLDEPTVGLDPEQRLEFRELLRSLDGAGIVLSTHLVEDVASVCDEVIVLDRGQGRVRWHGGWTGGRCGSAGARRVGTGTRLHNSAG